jgi:hypothetical protein
MHTSPLQMALLDQLSTLDRVSIPVPIEVRVAAASLMLHVLDHFESLTQLEQAVEQRRTRGLDDVIQQQLLLALSFEHAGLDRLLSAATAHQRDEGTYLLGIYKQPMRTFDNLLRSAPKQLKPTLLDMQGNVRHDVEDFYNIHHDVFRTSMADAFCDPTKQYHRFIDIVSAIQTRAGDYSPNLLAHYIDKLIAEHCAVDDPRRIALLGTTPQPEECTTRLERVVFDLIYVRYPRNETKAGGVQRFIELVERNPRYTDQALARDFHAVFRNLYPDHPCEISKTKDGLPCLKLLLEYLNTRGAPLGAIVVSVIQTQLDEGCPPESKSWLLAKTPPESLNTDTLELCPSLIFRTLLSVSSSQNASTWQDPHQVICGVLLPILLQHPLEASLPDDVLIQLYRFTGDSTYLRNLGSDALRADTLEADLGL